MLEHKDRTCPGLGLLHQTPILCSCKAILETESSRKE
uniref:Uncharacterized protein n=1 Tax=Rhizophora mucronata TaxID=61149 RepID=A0A2P2P811_RHIMU